MKSVLVVAVSLVLSSNVFASKARVASLQEANHLVDIQTVFTNPSHINSLNPYITFEMGTAQGATAAEGGFARKLEGGNTLGVYLGHDNTTSLRDGTTYLKQRNPIEVTYGFGNQAISGSLSTTDDKKNGKKESTLVAKYGVSNEASSYYVHFAAISQAEQVTPAQKISAPQIALGGHYSTGEDRYFGKLSLTNAKVETTASATTKVADIELGWLNNGLKKADADIYYGAKIWISQTDVAGAKITDTKLPVFLGLEYNAASWLVFRGSVKQNFLLGSKKDETATNTDAQSVPADTKVAAGLGLKYNQLTLDGSLSASNSGKINGTDFLSEASVTYNY